MDLTGFIGGSTAGRTPDASAARSLNLFPVEVATTPPQLALQSIPGLRRWGTLPEAPVRGLYTATNGRVFGVAGRTLYELDVGGLAPARGTLAAGTEVVHLTDNGLMLTLVDGTHGYGLTFATNAFGPTTDPDFHGGRTIGFLDGRFVWDVPGTGQFQWSELYSPSIDALAFATAEARADPLVGLLVDHRELWLFGTQTTEVLYSTGDPFTPFQRLPGALMELGSVGPHVMAALQNTVFWVSSSPRGHGLVLAAQGYQPQRISTPAVEYALGQSHQLAQTVALTYTQEGHGWYGLLVPDLETSWWFDTTTQQWSERTALHPDGTLHPWPGGFHTVAWGEHLVGDYRTGTVYVLDPQTYDLAGRPLLRRRVTPPVRQDQEWLGLTRLRVHLETGVGLDQAEVPGHDPQVMLRVSRDGGHVWERPQWASMGRIGQYGQTVEWRRLGRARQFSFELSVTDPVPVTFLSASVT